MEQMAYVKRIRDLREDHDYTQEQIAQFLGTSQTMYARYERAANELPIHHLLTLCSLYQVSSDYILGLTDISTPPPAGIFKKRIWPFQPPAPIQAVFSCPNGKKVPASLAFLPHLG